MISILPDLFSEIHLHSADRAFVFPIHIFNLRAIELAISFNDVIVSCAFKDRLADERAKLQSAYTDFHHCDLRFSDLIGEHVWNLQEGFGKPLIVNRSMAFVYRLCDNKSRTAPRITVGATSSRTITEPIFVGRIRGSLPCATFLSCDIAAITSRVFRSSMRGGEPSLSTPNLMASASAGGIMPALSAIVEAHFIP